MINVETRKLKLSQINLNPGNPRTISNRDMDRLVKSLQEFPEMMQLREIVIDEDMVCLGGNMRTLALRKAGATEVSAKVVTGLTPEQKREFVIKDNGTNWGEWDMDALSSSWSDLPLTDWGVDLPEDWMGGGEKEGLTDPDEVPEPPKVAITKPGDIWLCGKHRVMCGDSTKAEDVERLMDGEKADMVFTDPPYGVDLLKGKNKTNIGLSENKYRSVINDDRPFDPMHLLSLSDHHIIFGANYFCDKLPISKSWIVWVKKSDDAKAMKTFASGELAWTSFEIPLKIYKWVWQSARYSQGIKKDELVKRVHPTQKPVGLIEGILNDFCDDDFKIILDPYLGSGSTLIACEKTNRKCFGIEIDPHYVDIIIKRWEDYTGEKSKLEER